MLIHFHITAFDKINNLQSEIFLARSMDIYDDITERQLKERQEMLASMLVVAKPLNGKGFFNVDRPMMISIISAATTYIIILIQFNMSEKTTSCAPCSLINQTIL
jgi:hypothetical protein